MAVTGGFGTTHDTRTGRSRAWYMRSDGVKRWADTDKPVEQDEAADTGTGERPDA